MNYQQIPKVELHRHLECSMRFSTLIEIAKTKGISIPEQLELQKKQFLVTEPMLDLESVLNKFLVTQSILDSEEILTRLTYEVIEDAFHEGIKVLELRYAPTFVQLGHPHLSFQKIHDAIVKGQKMAEKFAVATGLICIIQRILPVSSAQEVTEFAIANKDTFIALDLADNEDGFDSKPFSPFFEKAKAAGLKITIHSGEINHPKAPFFVKDAIEILHADRIGHGVQIYKSPEMIAYVKQKQIPLELCVTSNWLTQAVPTTKSHPIKFLYDQGVNVSINSDDPGVFDISLCHEYEILHKEQNFSLELFQKINNAAARVSFISKDKINKVWNF